MSYYESNTAPLTRPSLIHANTLKRNPLTHSLNAYRIKIGEPWLNVPSKVLDFGWLCPQLNSLHETNRATWHRSTFWCMKFSWTLEILMKNRSHRVRSVHLFFGYKRTEPFWKRNSLSYSFNMDIVRSGMEIYLNQKLNTTWIWHNHFWLLPGRTASCLLWGFDERWHDCHTGNKLISQPRCWVEFHSLQVIHHNSSPL